MYRRRTENIQASNGLKWKRSHEVTIAVVSSNWLIVNCGVIKRSILGPLLFLIYINDLPNLCSQIDVYLFADDNNKNGLNCSSEEIQTTLLNITKWLNAKKAEQLKPFWIEIKESASKHHFKIESDYVMKNESKCLGITVDSEFSYQLHIKLVVARMSRQYSVIPKLRLFVPRYRWPEYNSSVINANMQYGILVYACCTISSLFVGHQLQKKMFKMIFFLKRRDQINDLFIGDKICLWIKNFWDSNFRSEIVKLAACRKIFEWYASIGKIGYVQNGAKLNSSPCLFW